MIWEKHCPYCLQINKRVMRKRVLNKKGLTLIEIIISLLLVGIVAAVVGMSSVHMVKSFLFSEKNVDTLLKGQIAIARMQKELNNLKKVSASPVNSITFSSYRDDATRTISLSGNDLLLVTNGDADKLTDQVSSFSLAYYDNFSSSAGTTFLATTKIIEITLQLTGADNVTSEFKARITPSFDTSIAAP